MISEERYYYVLNCADVTNRIFRKATQTSPLSVRHSIDGTKVILSFCNHDLPFEVMSLAIAGPYTAAEMRTYIKNNALVWEDSE